MRLSRRRGRETAPAASRTRRDCTRSAVGVDIAADVFDARALVLDQLFDIEPAPCGCLERHDRRRQAGACSGPDGGVCLVIRSIAFADHGISSQSSSSQSVASSSQAGGLNRPSNTGESLIGIAGLLRNGGRSGVDGAGLTRVHAEAFASYVGVAAGDDDGARSHVLLLADHSWDAFGSYRRTPLRVLEQVVLAEVAVGAIVGGR